MIKFWKEDFKYIQRNGSTKLFEYVFTVGGESANYLINNYGFTKYSKSEFFNNLKYIDIFIHCYFNQNVGEKVINIVIKKEKGLFRKSIFSCYKEDIDELFKILYPTIINDIRSYEEYLCNSDCYKQDYRWGFVGWNVTEHILENKEEEKSTNEKK